MALQAELREQIRGSTVLGHCPRPDVEDLGLETPCDPMGLSGSRSPSLETVVLPAPVDDDGAAGSASFQEELS